MYSTYKYTSNQIRSDQGNQIRSEHIKSSTSFFFLQNLSWISWSMKHEAWSMQHDQSRQGKSRQVKARQVKPSQVTGHKSSQVTDGKKKAFYLVSSNRIKSNRMEFSVCFWIRTSTVRNFPKNKYEIFNTTSSHCLSVTLSSVVTLSHPHPLSRSGSAPWHGSVFPSINRTMARI